MSKSTQATEGRIRTFDTGATRDTDDGKPDYEGFLSPEVLYRYGQYMSKHRVQADGALRASDNWQNGIPIDQYMKSMTRHVFDTWRTHRAAPERRLSPAMEELLCAVIFNAMGYLFEVLREKTKVQQGSMAGHTESAADIPDIPAVGVPLTPMQQLEQRIRSLLRGARD